MIYFVQQGNSGPIKVGFVDASGPVRGMRERLSGLQVGNPNPLVCLATIEGSEAEEEALQSRLKPWHIRGEWFQPAPKLLSLIVEQGTPFVDRPLLNNFHEDSVDLGWAEDLRKAFSKGVSA